MAVPAKHYELQCALLRFEHCSLFEIRPVEKFATTFAQALAAFLYVFVSATSIKDQISRTGKILLRMWSFYHTFIGLSSAERSEYSQIRSCGGELTCDRFILQLRFKRHYYAPAHAVGGIK